MALLSILLSLAACSQPASSEGEASGVEESTTADESTTAHESTTAGIPEPDESESGTPPPPDLPPAGSACYCQEGELCVGVCQTDDWGDGKSIIDSYCIDDPACEAPNFDNPACREAACGWAYTLTHLLHECEGHVGYDIVCLPWANVLKCDGTFQDCPDGEKCVIAVVDETFTAAVCVSPVGTSVAGESCTSKGFDIDGGRGRDTCDAFSMCWNGEPKVDPFKGTCRSFCPDFGSPCPDGTVCELVLPDFPLCTPV